jgi:hypothetical protein
VFSRFQTVHMSNTRRISHKHSTSGKPWRRFCQHGQASGQHKPASETRRSTLRGAALQAPRFDPKGARREHRPYLGERLIPPPLPFPACGTGRSAGLIAVAASQASSALTGQRSVRPTGSRPSCRAGPDRACARAIRLDSIPSGAQFGMFGARRSRSRAVPRRSRRGAMPVA